MIRKKPVKSNKLIVPNTKEKVYNYQIPIEKHYPIRLDRIRKSKFLWREDFGEGNIVSYYRINFHDPSDNNFIKESFFSAIYEKTNKLYTLN